jgi:hypothetical protein
LVAIFIFELFTFGVLDPIEDWWVFAVCSLPFFFFGIWNHMMMDIAFFCLGVTLLNGICIALHLGLAFWWVEKDTNNKELKR